MRNLKYTILLAALAAIVMTACKKLIAVDTPQNQLTTDKVFQDTTAITAALGNIYASFDKTVDVNYNKDMGLYTDELIYPAAPNNNFLTSKLPAGDNTVLNIWKNNYFIIYSCNDLIGQLQNSTALPSDIVQAYTAEAKFLRAYAYFYLVNSFGPVPLLLTTEVDQTVRSSRADSVKVYQQMVADLTDARSALPVNYAGGERVRANKWAATAMLARLSLYQRNWAAAESQATLVINSGLYQLTSSPAGTFLANSTESILQFWTQYGYITDAPTLIPGTGRPLYPLTTALLNAFEAGDLRKTSWLKATVVSGVTYYYPYKYHNRTNNTAAPEYLSALRLAEQYLIRAEARAAQNDLSGAASDLNMIRARAGLSPVPATLTRSALLDAIIKEWRVEFFMEWGHRYLELKRTGRLNAVMGNYKTTWAPNAVLLPVPQNELIYDVNLVQNPGY